MDEQERNEITRRFEASKRPQRRADLSQAYWDKLSSFHRMWDNKREDYLQAEEPFPALPASKWRQPTEPLVSADTAAWLVEWFNK